MQAYDIWVVTLYSIELKGFINILIPVYELYGTIMHSKLIYYELFLERPLSLTEFNHLYDLYNVVFMFLQLSSL